MTIPVWLKPAAYGFVVGAIALAIIGFSWGGWMTASAADTLATKRAKADVTAALVPVCIEQSQADPDQTAKRTAITAATKYNRREALMKAGWATMPGATEPDRNLADACLAALKLDAN